MSTIGRERAPVDFSSGAQPTVQWFKSIAVLVEVNGAGDDFTVPADALASFVGRYDIWYKDVVGAASGRRLHLLYHREVSLVGEVPIECASSIVKVGLASRAAGMGFSVTVELRRALEHQAAFEALLRSRVVRSMGIHHREDAVRPPDDDARRLIERTVESGVEIGMIGPVHYFRSIGVLSSGVLNAGNVTVHPRSGAGERAGSGGDGASEACFSRFRIWIDTDGSLYPCLGLRGIASGRLGSVHEPPGNTVLGGRPTVLDLGRLARVGPAVSPSTTGLSPCDRHRLEISGAVET
ncbi:MAG: hypothetical protein R3B70_23950 [Polyangiaceae bacterium]